MTLWRASNHATLDGRGGLRASGRWHSRGRRIVYCAPHPAGALLEVLVHAEIDLEDLPIHLRYIEIEAPDSLSVETLDTALLGSAWRTRLPFTRRLGDAWLESARSALLRVPSAIVPATWNVLINTQHPASAQLRIVRTHRQPIDPRLLG